MLTELPATLPFLRYKHFRVRPIILFYVCRAHTTELFLFTTGVVWYYNIE